MESSFEAAYRASRRQYEWGRLRTAILHASVIVVLVALAAETLFGRWALPWLPLTFAALTFAEWRGGEVMKGARRGLLVGFGSMLLPLSLLRPCCGTDVKAAGASCCIMPSACWLMGAFVGLAMVLLLLPTAPKERRMQSAAGLVLGVAAVAITRCSMLYVGEAVGLFGGLIAGVVATGLARAWLGRFRAVT
ncbi:MAG: hypothetical protein ABW133_12470 [Polyangiaceae bacterium]